MLKYVNGDIFKANVEALVNPVNCVGIMGKGLALQFKRRFSENFVRYKHVCENNDLSPGSIYIVGGDFNENGQTVINAATKDHWKDKSEKEWIYDCLESIGNFIYDNEVKSIAIPALGCGEGGLEWLSVKDMIDDVFTHEDFKDVEIFIYEPKE